MKTLKFTQPLSELILKWEKNSTWRINDDKDLKLWDKVLFLTWPILHEFAQWIIAFVKVTTFGNITPEDMDWHEKFSSNKEMLATYSKYYNIEVTNETELKIIRFKLI